MTLTLKIGIYAETSEFKSAFQFREAQIEQFRKVGEHSATWDKYDDNGWRLDMVQIL